MGVIQHLRATAARWTATNRVLAEGELGYERGTGKSKIGDGATGWTGLPYSVLDNDGRLINARTPTAHATSHGPGGTDPLSGIAGFDPTVPTVLSFSGNPASVIHGNHFWPVGVDLGLFSWEFWACLGTASTGYLISEGYGGAHAILFTVGPAPSGNVYDGVTATFSFGGGYSAQVGEWHHARVGWDGTFIYTWINGIPVSMTAWPGPRRAQQGGLFIAGSDHSSYQGKIAQVRGFEGSCPHFINIGHLAAFTPQRCFTPTLIAGVDEYYEAALCSHYLGTPAAMIVADHSPGFGGRQHPGRLTGTQNGALDAELQKLPGPTWVVDPTAPFNALTEPARTRVPVGPTTVPSGDKIFDSQGRDDSIPAFTSVLDVGGQYATNPGSTEGGSLGPRAWQNLAPGNPWGVFNNSIRFFGPNGGGLYVTGNSGDMDVRVDRANAVGYSAAAPISGLQNGDIGLIARLQDTSNFLFAYAFHDQFGNNFVSLQRRVAGVDTEIVRWNLPNFTWTTLRIVTSGTTITGYADATQIGTQTVTQFQAAVGAGIFAPNNSNAAVGWHNFRVR